MTAGVSRVMVLVPPWVLLVALLPVGAVSHWLWGDAPAVTWTTLVGTLATVALTALTWMVARDRALLGRAHSTVTPPRPDCGSSSRTSPASRTR
ncbi:hypothetical protein [Actinomadura sp. CNU-125]|uniref:hypothetical protein n=1 Tax=Actinomadura sp. CNU-125 TaxID=1904961 RepID=UPI0021CD0DDB|nr:hypothetical protein [Actinomadura sp. CNU-125]